MVLEVLFHARRILKRRGWIQGNSASERGVCLTQALSLAASKTRYEWSNTLYHRVLMAIKQNIADDPRAFSLIEFNDTKGRTKREIFAVLNRTIRQEIAKLPIHQRIVPMVRYFLP